MIQDSARSCYSTNNQSTVHPFVTYYKDSEAQIQHISFVIIFASLHGKGLCVGVEGSLKRAAAQASLQRPLDNQIVNANDLFKFGKGSEKSM